VGLVQASGPVSGNDPDPTDVSVLRQGIDTFLNDLKSKLDDTSVLGQALPIVGSGLQTAGNFVDALLTQIDSALAGRPQTGSALKTLTTIANALGITDPTQVISPISFPTARTISTATSQSTSRSCRISNSNCRRSAARSNSARSRAISARYRDCSSRATTAPSSRR
jgi:hypothetical protein